MSEAKPDPYIDAKLDEAYTIFCDNFIGEGDGPKFRETIRPLLVQIYQDGHLEGVKDGTAEAAAMDEAHHDQTENTTPQGYEDDEPPEQGYEDDEPPEQGYEDDEPPEQDECNQ